MQNLRVTLFAFVRLLFSFVCKCAVRVMGKGDKIIILLLKKRIGTKIVMPLFNRVDQPGNSSVTAHP